MESFLDTWTSSTPPNQGGVLQSLSHSGNPGEASTIPPNGIRRGKPERLYPDHQKVDCCLPGMISGVPRRPCLQISPHPWNHLSSLLEISLWEALYWVPGFHEFFYRIHICLCYSLSLQCPFPNQISPDRSNLAQIFSHRRLPNITVVPAMLLLGIMDFFHYTTYWIKIFKKSSRLTQRHKSVVRRQKKKKHNNNNIIAWLLGKLRK